MRIAVIGGRGLIGRALAADLAAHGHQVVLGLRRIGDAPRDAIEVDYARPEPERWRRQLAGVDALVNAVGIFRERGAQRFEAIHVDGPLALFRAAAEAGVPRIVQISALGADPDSPLPYFSSKGRADAALLASPTDAAVVRPSLVFAPSGVSARGFLRLAALPLTPLPGGGRQPIQPLHLDDLCTGLRRLLEDPAQRGVVAAVGPAPLRLRDYLAALRRGLGLRGRLRVLPVPGALARAGARLAALSPRSLATPESLRMLEGGNVADPARFAALLGRPPRPPAAFVDAEARAALRLRARLDWLLPPMRWSVALLWLATAWVSLFAYPVPRSLELLARTGLHGTLGVAALYGAAGLDALLGLGTLFARTRRWAYRAQLALIAFYTAAITLCLPEYWAHPYGPVLKNLPLLAMILALHELDEPHGSGDR